MRPELETEPKCPFDQNGIELGEHQNRDGNRVRSGTGSGEILDTIMSRMKVERGLESAFDRDRD